MNACDLEETKHMALQKFLYLANNSPDWVRKISYSPCPYPNKVYYSCGGFDVYEWRYREPLNVAVTFASEMIAGVEEHIPPEPKSKGKKSAELYDKQRAEAREKFEDNEVVRALRKIANAISEKEKRKRDEDACKRIRDALLGNKPEESPQTTAQVIDAALSRAHYGGVRETLEQSKWWWWLPWT